MRKVEQIMGMAVTIDIPDCDKPDIFKTVFAELRRIDNNYSNYKPESEISRFASGEITEAQISKELKQILVACRKAQKETDGYFSAWAGDTFDANGYIKGWAINQAGKVISKLGYKTFCVGAGGDILARGNKTWKIGIQDPFDNQKVVKIVELKDQAIATSGSYERGLHIINPKTKKPSDYWASVSVIGPSIVQADILATAIFAKGKNAGQTIKLPKNYKLITVDKSGRVF